MFLILIFKLFLNLFLTFVSLNVPCFFVCFIIFYYELKSFRTFGKFLIPEKRCSPKYLPSFLFEHLWKFILSLMSLHLHICCFTCLFHPKYTTTLQGVYSHYKIKICLVLIKCIFVTQNLLFNIKN